MNGWKNKHLNFSVSKVGGGQGNWEWLMIQPTESATGGPQVVLKGGVLKLASYWPSSSFVNTTLILEESTFHPAVSEILPKFYSDKVLLLIKILNQSPLISGCSSNSLMCLIISLMVHFFLPLESYLSTIPGFVFETGYSELLGWPKIYLVFPTKSPNEIFGQHNTLSFPVVPHSPIFHAAPSP